MVPAAGNMVPPTDNMVPEMGKLCLYGFPSEQWEVNLPAEEVNFASRGGSGSPGDSRSCIGMKKQDWFGLIAVHTDVWLLAVSFYFGARFGFDISDRKLKGESISVVVSWGLPCARKSALKPKGTK